LLSLFKVDLLIIVVIAPSSALIQGSSAPSLVGDRPSHPIYRKISTTDSHSTYRMHDQERHIH